MMRLQGYISCVLLVKLEFHAISKWVDRWKFGNMKDMKYMNVRSDEC